MLENIAIFFLLSVLDVVVACIAIVIFAKIWEVLDNDNRR